MGWQLLEQWTTTQFLVEFLLYCQREVVQANSRFLLLKSLVEQIDLLAGLQAITSHSRLARLLALFSLTSATINVCSIEVPALSMKYLELSLEAALALQCFIGRRKAARIRFPF
jgi:hypothetical protein